MTRPRRLPLHEVHGEYGARMVESEGWSMPQEYAGVFAEYRAHRRAAVVWDASNLGAIRVSGRGAYDLIQTTFTNDLSRCAPGRSQYTLLLSEVDGSIVDDLMVWWVDRDQFMLTPSRPGAVMRVLRARVPGTSCAVEDHSHGRVLLALQGARARDRMADLDAEAASMAPLRVRRVKMAGGTALVATTRFGGQTGFELHLAPELGRSVYRHLVGRGATPAGLGMRETHRVEVGIPRHGFELGPSITPLEAGLTRAVGLDTAFIGRAALERRRRQGVRHVLRSVIMNGRQVPSPGADVVLNGRRVGRVTSGNYSPRLHRGLGLAFVGADVPPECRVSVGTARGEAEADVAPVGAAP